MTLIKIDHTEYGLEETKAKQISEMFKPMLDRMENLEIQYNEILTRDIEPETIQMAHDLRLAYVKVRTGTDAIHKDLKSFYLQGGRFVDGWRNAQRMTSQGNEEKLRAIEDHFVNIEKEKVEKLQAERSLALSPYTEFIPNELGEMAQDVWENYLSGVKLNYEATLEAERKAEEDRLAAQKREDDRNERARKDVWRLRKEAREREVEQTEKNRIHEEQLAKERQERECVEKEFRERKETERKAQEKEEARIQAELNMKDDAKVLMLIRDLDHLKTKYSFKSKKNQKMYSDVIVLIDKVISHINWK